MANFAIIAELIGKDAISPAARSAVGSIGALEAAGGRATGMLGGMATAAARAGAAVGAIALGGVVAGLGAATHAAMGFEATMSGIAAVSGLDQVGQEFKDLSALALKLGADTSFSATEAAKGIEELTKAGVSLDDVMQGAAQSTLDLAAAGGVEVAEAATIASNAMNVFNKSGADMAHIADQIAGAANSSAIDVHEFGFSLSAVGAVANTVGFSFEDTAAAIAVMGQAGLRGSDAGTSLKTMLLNLQPSTAKAIEQFQDLGIITEDGANQFFNAAGEAKSMGEIAGVLQTSLAGLTKAQQLQALETMFGTDAIRAAAIMADGGAESFRKMQDQIGNVSAQDVANARLNNLAGSIEKLKGSVETVAITFGQRLTPGLKTLADRATEAVNASLPMVTVFGDQLVGAVESAAATLGDLTDRFSEWFATVLGIDTADITDPFQRIYDALTVGLPNALAELRERFSGVEAFVIERFSGISDFITQHWQSAMVGAAGVVAVAMVASARASIAAWLPVAVPIIAVGAAIAVLYEAWQQNIGGMQEQTEAFYAEAIVPTFGRLEEWLAERIPAAFDWLMHTGWPALIDGGRRFVGWVQTEALPALEDLAGWLGEKLGGALTVAAAAWPVILNLVGRFSSLITSTVIPNLEDFADLMGRVFGSFGRGDMLGGIGVFADALLEMFRDFGATVTGALQAQVARIDWAAVWSNARGIVGALADQIISTGTELGGRLGAWLGEQWGVAWAAIKEQDQSGIAEGVEIAFGAVTTAISQAAAQIPGMIDTIIKTGQEFVAWVGTMNQTLSDLGVYDNVAEAFKQIGYGFDVIGAAFRDNGPAVQSTIEGLTPQSAGLAEGIRDLSLGFRDFGNWFRENSPLVRDSLMAIGGTLQAIKDNGPSVVGVILSFVGAFAALQAVLAVQGIVATMVALGPLGLVIGGIALAVGLLATAWVNNWGDIQGKTGAVVDFIGTKFSELGTFLSTTSENMAATLNTWAANIDQWNAERTAAWNAWHEERTAAWNAFWTGLGAAWDTWNQERTDAWNAWNQERTDAWNEFLQGIRDGAEAGWHAIYETIRSNWESISTNAGDMLGAIGQTISDGWNEIWGRAGDAWHAIWQIITDNWQSIFDASANALGTIRDQIAGSAGAVGEAAGSFGKAIFDGILDWVGKITGAVGGVIDAVKRMLPGGPGGGGGEPVPDVGGANSAAVGNMSPTEYVRYAAAMRGIDPDQVAKVMAAEGGSIWNAVGSFPTGTSYGPLQLHYAGGSDPQRGMGDAFTAATGIDLRASNDDIAAQMAAINYALDQLLAAGDYHEWYGADPALGSRFTKINRIAPVDITGGGTAAAAGIETVDLSVSQMDWASGMASAKNICGPYLAALFADAVGRPPTAQEAADMAQRYAWSPTQGMKQNDQVDDLANAFIAQLSPTSGMSVTEQYGTTGQLNAIASQSLAGGAPVVGFNTPAHYFAADQYNQDTGQYHVGATGTVMQNYAAAAGLSGVDLNWLSVDQIKALGDGLTSVLTIAGQAGGAVTNLVDTALTPLGEAAVGVTDSTGAMAAGVVDATGQAAAGFDEFGNTISVLPETLEPAGEAFGQFGETMTEVPESLEPTNEAFGGLTESAGALGEATATAAEDMTGAIGGLPDAIAEPVEGVAELLGEQLPATVEEMRGQITGATDEMSGQVQDATGEMQDEVVSAVETMASDSADATDTMSSEVQDILSELASEAGSLGDEIGSNLGDGISSGMDSAVSAVEESASQIIDAAQEAAEAAAEIASPSKRTARIGRNWGLGLVAGMHDTLPLVQKMARDLVEPPSSGLAAAAMQVQARTGQAYTDGGSSQGDTVTVHINLPNYVGTMDEAAEAFESAMVQRKRRNGRLAWEK